MTNDLDVLAQLEQLDAERVLIVRVIVAVGPDGGPRQTGERIYRGSFQRPRDSHEPHSQER